MARGLQATYAYYNRRYFEGQLPDVPVAWSEVITDIASFHYDRGPDGAIFISKKFKPYPMIWRLALLHEMVHVKLQDNPDEIRAKSDTPRTHSKVWRKEMRKLAALGAFDLVW